MAKKATTKKATTKKAPARRKSYRKSYRDVEHTHILAAVAKSHYTRLRCTLRGCQYVEYWDGERYRPATPTGTAQAHAQAQAAIRPFSLWGELRP